MINIKKIATLLALTSTCFASNVYAATSNIDGMFGYKLGQSFDSKGEPKAITDISLGYIYKLQVPEDKKISYFDNYYVYTTPQSKKINGFLALKDYGTDQECLQSQKSFFNAIKETYGTTGIKESEGYIQDKDNSNIGIKIECVQNRLILNNLNISLTEQAIKENSNIENQPNNK